MKIVASSDVLTFIRKRKTNEITIKLAPLASC